MKLQKRTFTIMTALMVLLIFSACRNGNPNKTPISSVKPLQQSSEITDSTTDPPPATKPVPPEDTRNAPAVVLYDLAAHIHDAHLRSGGLLIDFGTDARNKYTLGDWRSGFRGNFESDGVTFSYVQDAAARLFVHLLDDEAGDGKIVIRARSVSGRKATGRIYLNGQIIGTVNFAGNAYEHAILPVSDLRAGHNEILMRFSPTARGHDRRTARLLLDTIRVIPETAAETQPAARMTSVLDTRGGDDAPRIQLRSGESLTWHFPWIQREVLQGKMRRTGGGPTTQVRVIADVHGQEQVIHTSVANVEVSSWTVPLSGFTGEALSLRMEVTGGEILFEEAVIVREAETAVRAPGRTRAQNVILVMIDTLRADRFSVYNSDTRVLTPFTDRLALECALFERAWVQENWTKPSIASLLTGLYPSTHQTKTDTSRLPASALMASEHFQTAGIVTAGFVANGYVSGKFGFERGWDTWTNYVREGKRNRAQFVIDDAVTWLQKRDEDRPFFLYVHTIDPHVPYLPPNRYRDLYDSDPYNGPVLGSKTPQLLAQIKTGAVRLNDRDKFRLEALYDGEISYHDDQLVRLYEEMARQGLLDDTLLIVTSDHGEEFFEHGSVGHGHSMYEEMLHVPLLIRLPGATAGRMPVRFSEEVELVDILPTMCESLAVACPDGIHGKSLLSRMTQEAIAPWPSRSHAEFLDHQRAIRTARYKLLYRGLRSTLFDLKEDPGETIDRTDDLPVAFMALRDHLGSYLGQFVPQGEASLSASRQTTTPSRQRVHQKEEAVIDPETRRQLQELGYMLD